MFASLWLELLAVSESPHLSPPDQLGPISVPLASGCANSICILTGDTEGLSFGVVTRKAMRRPARNTCKRRRDLVSSLLNFIYKASRGRSSDAMPASAFQNLLDGPESELKYEVCQVGFTLGVQTGGSFLPSPPPILST